MAIITHSTLDDLYRFDGKAELIAGRIVQIMPSGKLHARISKRILIELDNYARRTGVGEAFGDALGYALAAPLPNGRESFCPDVSYLAEPDVGDDERFVDGPPTFAVEVRSEHQYGPAAERELADKRADYFLAGTLAVWDVDPRTQTITLYRAASPEVSEVFTTASRPAHAEPALPGFRTMVAELFG
jgi:Uma2 family endonuclease